MSFGQDPFLHHPELRDKITDPLKSFFRDFNAKDVFKKHQELHWVLDELRAQSRRDNEIGAGSSGKHQAQRS